MKNNFALSLLFLMIIIFAASPIRATIIDTEIQAISSGNDQYGQGEKSPYTETDVVDVIIKRNEGKEFYSDDFNLYGFIALGIALLSFIVAICTWVAQQKTEKHTRRIPLSSLLHRFSDVFSLCFDGQSTILAALLHYAQETENVGSKDDKYAIGRYLRSLSISKDYLFLDVDAEVKYIVTKCSKDLNRFNDEIDETINHVTQMDTSNDVIIQDLSFLFVFQWRLFSSIRECEWNFPDTYRMRLNKLFWSGPYYHFPEKYRRIKWKDLKRENNYSIFYKFSNRFNDYYEKLADKRELQFLHDENKIRIIEPIINKNENDIRSFAHDSLTDLSFIIDYCMKKDWLKEYALCKRFPNDNILFRFYHLMELEKSDVVEFIKLALIIDTLIKDRNFPYYKVWYSVDDFSVYHPKA